MRKLLRILILSFLCTAAVLGVVKLSWILDARNKAEILSTQRQTGHFNIYTDMDQSQMDFYVMFLEDFYSYFEDNYFKLNSQKPLEVYLFKNEQTYRPYVQSLYKDYTPYGFYTGFRTNRIVVNGDSGLGTVTHELVHYFIDVGFKTEPPKWVDEGIATFFEKFIGHFEENGELSISFGYFSNWRFPITKKAIEGINLSDLINSPDPEQCCLRSFSLFLHKKNLFSDCIGQWQKATDQEQWISILEQVYGAPIAQIEIEWKTWVKEQPIDGDVELVASAFVLPYQQWQHWWAENQNKLYWSEHEKIYRVRK